MKKMFDEVKDILTENKQTRSDDIELYQQVLFHSYDHYDLAHTAFLVWRADVKARRIPSLECIRKVRYKVQKACPELRNCYQQSVR